MKQKCISERAPLDIGGGDFLPETIYGKTRTSTISTCNETAIIPKVVVFKACILNNVYYQQSQSSKLILKPINRKSSK